MPINCDERVIASVKVLSVVHEVVKGDDMFSDDDDDREPVVCKLRMQDSSIIGLQRARELADGHPGQIF